MSTDPALARQVLDGLDTEFNGFCPCCKFKPSKEGGYVQLSFEGANKFATLGEVLLWSKGVTLNVAGDQCSHLCGNPLCCDATHVVVESAQKNNQRKGCLVVWQCFHCPKVYLTCPHGPSSCIKFVSGFSSWEDFLANGKHE